MVKTHVHCDLHFFDFADTELQLISVTPCGQALYKSLWAWMSELEAYKYKKKSLKILIFLELKFINLLIAK